jgi:hypothetical protein
MGKLVYTFRMLSGEEEDFRRDFEILDNQTFFDFHLAIQEDLGYDKSQMASFILTNDQWEREEEITLFDMKEEPSDETLIMDQVKIVDVCKTVRQKLLYIHDFFSDRGFFIEVVRMEDAESDKKYPVCILSEGKIPIQIIVDDNNIDTLAIESFDDLENLDDDITFENIDDYEGFQ